MSSTKSELPSPLRRIVAGFEGGQGSSDALQLAGALSAATGAELLVAVVFDEAAQMESDARGYIAARDEFFDTAFTAARSQLGAVGFEARPIVDRVARALHNLAEDEDADLLVLGSSGRGPLGRVAAGTNAGRLLHGSPCAVAMPPRGISMEGSRTGIERVGVAFDGSAESEEALSLGAGLATATGGSLRLIMASGAGKYHQRSDDESRELLDAALRRLPAGIEAEARLLPGKAVKVLESEAADLDLLVMGSRDYGPVRRVLLGSTSAALFGSAQCVALIVPRARSRSATETGTLWGDSRSRLGSPRGASLHSSGGEGGD